MDSLAEIEKEQKRWQNTTLKSWLEKRPERDMKFSLIDPESFNIVTPKFEQWMAKYLALKKGDVFLDIGAHIGKYTIQVAKIVGDKGLVISIEPHPENFKVLNKNLLLNQLRNVKTFNIAGWNEKCKLKLYEGKYSGLHSVKKDLQILLGNAPSERTFFNISAKPIDYVIKTLKVNVN